MKAVRNETVKLNEACLKKVVRRLAGGMTAALLIGSVTLLSGCNIGSWSFGDGRIEGNGNMVDSEYTLSDPGAITEIRLSNVSATVMLSATESDRITYSIDDNLTRYLEISDNNGVLSIDANNDKMLGRNRRITFNIGVASLEQLKIYGDVEIEGQGTFTTDQFTADISGAAEADMTIEADDISIDIAGAADFSLTGTTDTLEIDCDGAASISARYLIASDVSVNTNGASDIEVHAVNNLEITGAGVGTVVYWGDPSLSRSVSGFSSITRGEE
ncbi:MAG: DUF2807 domain-containing protein [Lachnospiraceae bacterium]|jgi:hypothetical protein|nr:DUF2807 domain-containing protein [Lachnospiraceae bacterium]